MSKKFVNVVKRVLKVLKAPIAALKRKIRKQPAREIPASVVPEVPLKQKQEQVTRPEVPISQRIQFYEQLGNKPQVMERPLKQVSQSIQQLVTRIEILKGIKRERPVKQVKPVIAALVETIEKLQKKSKSAVALTEQVEELALDEFFAWAQVPTYALDEFFAWAEIPIYALDEFFACAQVEMQEVGDLLTEEESNNDNAAEQEEPLNIRRCASFDAFDMINRDCFLSLSCPELPQIAC